MQFNTYTTAGARIACWLANSQEIDAAALAGVLTDYDVHEPAATPGQARALRTWAGRLREVFEAAAVADKALLADALLVDARCRPRLLRHGDDLPFHLHYASVRDDVASRVRALTAAGLAHLIDDGFGERLGSCRRPGCGVAFIDTSRNGGRKFCSVRCANQVNVALHRARGAGSR
ncbi:MAG TPA: CGNR zinc finger domain-containing protein [Streptosporangiaceae bacterium]|jgi:predicted RNA-binding Zn ribbon-like protein|nr:CGNR zinc finger domain-containing protein [Streptosporangiaceae bacterium]